MVHTSRQSMCTRVGKSQRLAPPSGRTAIGRVCGWIRVPTASGFAVRSSRDSIESRRASGAAAHRSPGSGTRIRDSAYGAPDVATLALPFSQPTVSY